MRIAIFGGTGLLGQGLTGVLMRKHIVYTPIRGQPPIVLNRPQALLDWLEQKRIELVLNAAGLADIDLCHQHQSEAITINGNMAAVLNGTAHGLGLPTVQFSCYDVFSGRLPPNHAYPENGPCQPVTVHGYIAAELESSLRKMAPGCTIIRLGHLFGPGRPNFIDPMIAAARLGQPVKVISDQLISPTYTLDVAVAIEEMLDRGPITGGVYHLVNRNPASHTDLADAIYGFYNLRPRIFHRSQSEFFKTTHPANCTLANTKLPPLPTWQDALARHLAVIRT